MSDRRDPFAAAFGGGNRPPRNQAGDAAAGNANQVVSPGGSVHIMRTRRDSERENQGEPTREALRSDEENMPPPVDINHPRGGGRRQPPAQDNAPNVQAVAAEVHAPQGDGEDDIEEAGDDPIYDIQEAIEEADKEPSVHDEAFAEDPPPPVGPRRPRMGPGDPEEEERRRMEAMRLEAEARAQRDAAREVADGWRAAAEARRDADVAEERHQIELEIQREVARRLTEERDRSEERKRAKKTTPAKVQEIARRMEEIAQMRAPNVTQSTPASPGARRRTGRLTIHGDGVNSSQAASPANVRTRDGPPTEQEVRKVLEHWGFTAGRGSKSARGSYANLNAFRDADIPVLADYARDLPQFAEEWGIELTSRSRHDLTQQLQRTVRRVKQELARMNEELQGAKNVVKM